MGFNLDNRCPSYNAAQQCTDKGFVALVRLNHSYCRTCKTHQTEVTKLFTCNHVQRQTHYEVQLVDEPAINQLYVVQILQAVQSVSTK